MIALRPLHAKTARRSASRLAAERGLTLIPPYDHPHVIAGQGTAALELFEEVGALDVLFVCVGGGGLISGSALAARALAPRLPGVSASSPRRATTCSSVPSGRDRAHRRAEDHRRRCADTAPRRADVRDDPALVDDVVTVSDPELVRAMRFFAERMKLVVEPTGCLGRGSRAGRQARDLRASASA